MVILIAGTIGFLVGCYIGAFLIKVVMLVAFSVGAVLYYVLKHIAKLLVYVVKLLPIIGYWVITQIYHLYQKRRVNDRNGAFYTEQKRWNFNRCNKWIIKSLGDFRCLISKKNTH